MSDICLEASDNLMQQPTQIRQADGTKQNKSIGNDSKHASMENKLDDTQKRNLLFARFIYSVLCQKCKHNFRWKKFPCANVSV